MTRTAKDDVQPFSSDRHLHIVAVTACATGVAHTYMAAEQLEKLAKIYRFSIKIETQGVLGLKNEIKPAEVISAIRKSLNLPRGNVIDL